MPVENKLSECVRLVLKLTWKVGWGISTWLSDKSDALTPGKDLNLSGWFIWSAYFCIHFFHLFSPKSIYLGEFRWLKVKALVSTSHTPGFKSQPYCLLAVWLWAGYLTSLIFWVLICRKWEQMGKCLLELLGTRKWPVRVSFFPSCWEVSPLFSKVSKGFESWWSRKMSPVINSGNVCSCPWSGGWKSRIKVLEIRCLVRFGL